MTVSEEFQTDGLLQEWDPRFRYRQDLQTPFQDSHVQTMAPPSKRLSNCDCNEHIRDVQIHGEKLIIPRGVEVSQAPLPPP